ncbi:hypothetical protein GE061_010437 [Apolygus lucorum]|uniref:Uncharacterized protein n=1 Tax=Apolygus lucorum TaxID=248454 RepID=A0A8S9XW07_APOLU|nr:hypothetical protein GE061_010437 [Apolygus lucorum]
MSQEVVVIDLVDDSTSSSQKQDLNSDLGLLFFTTFHRKSVSRNARLFGPIRRERLRDAGLRGENLLQNKIKRHQYPRFQDSILSQAVGDTSSKTRSRDTSIQDFRTASSPRLLETPAAKQDQETPVSKIPGQHPLPGCWRHQQQNKIKRHQYPRFQDSILSQAVGDTSSKTRSRDTSIQDSRTASSPRLLETPVSKIPGQHPLPGCWRHQQQNKIKRHQYPRFQDSILSQAVGDTSSKTRSRDPSIQDSRTASSPRLLETPAAKQDQETPVSKIPGQRPLPGCWSTLLLSFSEQRVVPNSQGPDLNALHYLEIHNSSSITNLFSRCAIHSMVFRDRQGRQSIRWVNTVLMPPEVNNLAWMLLPREKSLSNVPLPLSCETVSSKFHKNQLNLHNLRKAAHLLFKSRNVIYMLFDVDQKINVGCISDKDDLDLHNDQGARYHLVKMPQFRSNWKPYKRETCTPATAHSDGSNGIRKEQSCRQKHC